MTTESSREEAADEADQSCCSSSIASSSSATGRESNGKFKFKHLVFSLNFSVLAAVIGTDPSISVADQTHQKVDDHDYMTMDKVSCSSDSFSHLLSVPNQQCEQNLFKFLMKMNFKKFSRGPFAAVGYLLPRGNLFVH